VLAMFCLLELHEIQFQMAPRGSFGMHEPRLTPLRRGVHILERYVIGVLDVPDVVGYWS